MNETFGAVYAAAYDGIYREKDYAGECDAVEGCFRAHAGRPVRSVIDLGCGTGSHAVPLAARGYRVLGVDRSSPMLAAARRKAARLRAAARPKFVAGDVRSFRADERFDAALMMFAVLGYLVADDDLADGLATVRAHLGPGGLFVFDVWYGPAVEQQGPTVRERTVAVDPRGELRRTVSGELDREARRCRVTIELARFAEERRESLTRERHLVRYFDRPELARRLADADLELVALGAFPSLERSPDETSWNVLGAARAR